LKKFRFRRSEEIHWALWLLVIVFVSAASPATSSATPRWYNAEQSARGGGLFADHCAACHGGDAQGSVIWRERDAQGSYPPPPLDGTAHAWHHSLEVLRRTIRDGNARLDGQMPAFQHLLSAADIDAVIAWFQAKWPDEVYVAWTEGGAQAGGSLRSVTTVPEEKRGGTLTGLLATRVPTAKIGAPEPTAVEGIHRVKVGTGYVYLEATGRYAFTGDLLDLKEGTNLTKTRRDRDRLSMLARFPESDRVVYPAEGEEKATITVFTDPTCPYCRRLHTELPVLRKAGVAVSYVPFPREGPQSKAADQLRTVWCASDRREALDIAKGIREANGPSSATDCPAAAAVAAGYQLGVEVGVRGTPAIVMPDGQMIQGYRPAKDLTLMLGLR